MDLISNQSSKSETLLYRTFSICPKCAIIERKGIQWKEAQVFSTYGKVWLSVFCKIHGEHETLYCSNLDFFKRAMSFSFDLTTNDTNSSISTMFSKQVPDIEDLRKRLNFNSNSTNLPFVVELPVWETGDFISDDEIKIRLKKIQNLYPVNRQFVLKILAKSAMDIPKLNSKILFVESLIPGNIFLLETSYERLCLLCKEDNSIFLKPNIFPALKYYLQQGDEEQCISELKHLFKFLQTFTDMQMMVTLCLSRPYPTLQGVISFMRQQFGFIRVINISMERSPKELVNCLTSKTKENTQQLKEEKNNKNEKLSNKSYTEDELKHLNHLESTDVFELLQHIQKSTNISMEDFYPASMAAMMEPFLSMMGYGFFFARPSPMCAFWTCLVNTEKTFASYPVTRLFDFEKIFQEMKVILPRLQDGKIGIFNAQKLRKIFQSSVFPNKGPLPDLFSYLTDKSLAGETKKFIQNLQFVVVHNNMDVASLDLIRRCQCASALSSASVVQNQNQNQNIKSEDLKPSEIVAYCTGCI